MVHALQTTNLAVRFLVEVAALAALAGWGWQLSAGATLRWLAAVGIPLLAATLWAVLASPNAPVQAGTVLRMGVQVFMLGAATAALAASGHPRLATAFLTTAAINAALMALWRQ